MSDQPPDPFPVRLIKARARANLSYMQLASRANIPASTVWRLEAGAYPAKFHTLIKLCLALDCSADYLLGLKEEMK